MGDYMYKKKSANGLVEYCKRMKEDGYGYVYGSFGQVCTESLLDQYANMYPDNNLAGGEMRKVGKKWIGRRVVDCSGMIKYYLMTDNYGDNPRYSRAFDTAVHINNASEQGDISTIPEIPGVLLWMPGHVGVYIGNGKVIESKGTYYGVVETNLKGRGWKKWFKIPDISYDVLRLDTSYYKNKEGTSYRFISYSNKKPDILVSDVNVCDVEYEGKDSRGHLFRVNLKKEGSCEIKAILNQDTDVLKVDVTS